MPYVSRQVLGFSATQFGLLESVASVGILSSSVLIAFLSGKINNKRLFSFGIIAQSIALILYSVIVFPSVRNSTLLSPWMLFFLISVCLFFYRFFNSLFSIPLMSYLQLKVKESMQSRFFSLLILFKDITVPIGMALFGFLLAIISLSGLVLSIFFIRRIDLA